MSIRSFQDFHGLNEADTWTVYYKKGSFGREVVKSGLSKQAATRLYNKLSADIPSEYDGVEMVMEAVSDAQIRKVMKLTKNRPAPFAVVAVKGGKVVAQDIDIKTWELVLAHYREMAKAHPDAKIHVEDAEGQSVMESADMLPSYEVLIGLATVMGALDLVQAARGGDSIIVDVAKALKAELGDKLEAAGAEAKRMVSKFKNDPKIKEIIMDAEEEVNESKRSTAMKISLFEVTETGLMVIPHTNADANKIQKWVDKSGMYGEWDAREGYFLFPEEEDGFDELETELTKELNKLGVNYHIEGVFESNKSKQKDMTKIKLFEEYFNEAAPSPRHFTSPDYVGPEFAKKASDEDLQLLVKLKGEKLKMHDKHIRPIEDQIAKLMKKYGIKGIEESLSEAAVKIYKTISKKEWDRTPKDYKSVIDGVHYKMFNDPKMGTILAPVEISESLMEREYNTAQRKEMADSGEALPDGSFPIADEEDLKNAISSYGLGKDSSAAAKHIAKRARALGLADLIPDTEDFQKALKS